MRSSRMAAFLLLFMGLSYGFMAGAQDQDNATDNRGAEVGTSRTNPKPAFELTDSYHNDFRKGVVKIQYNRAFEVNTSDKTDPVVVAQAFLRDRHADYGVSDVLSLRLGRVKKSLLGTHVQFLQYKEGLQVHDGEIIVSVNKKGQVYQVFNNYFPEPKTQSRQPAMFFAQPPIISKEQAFDIVWRDLGVAGFIIDEPKAELMYYVTEQGAFRKAYKVRLFIQEPYGDWQHFVDAHAGKILEKRNTIIVEHKAEVSHKVRPAARQPIDRKQAFALFYAKQTVERQKKLAQFQLDDGAPAMRVDGTAWVFDPDPRTTLGNSQLQDTDPAEAFEDAYFLRTLKDIKLQDGRYYLDGPWVVIKDFETPTTAPSVSDSPAWTAKRGDNAFNDAMTYFHLDQNQRYIQSLGFTGEDGGIQFGPIEADSDGVYGQDNSHFVPSTNRIAFGHGCVDDNEDADVILHEYGHAIQFDINNNWSGGDTGAMGEGFGDYWAASYSIATEAGAQFEVNKVFNWDGHGDPQKCWPGRYLNRLDAIYDHSHNYRAHASLPNGPVGYQTDELWSTPLFQSLLKLRELGVPREEVDQIILQAHFGLGSGIKMRDMAKAIIATASTLQEGKFHKDVFIDKFLNHKIIELPHAVLKLVDLVWASDLGPNGVLDPGESADFRLSIKNEGDFPARGITATLTSSSDHVELVNTESVFADANPGQQVESLPNFEIKVSPNLACGQTIPLNVRLTFNGGGSSLQDIPVTIQTGKPIGFNELNATIIDIPDNQAVGVTSTLNLDVAEDVVIGDHLQVKINLRHTYISDLQVVLIAPSGKQVMLHNKSGTPGTNLDGIYPVNLRPAESLAALKGEKARGIWTLKIMDTAPQDVGQLVYWGLSEISGYECD